MPNNTLPLSGQWFCGTVPLNPEASISGYLKGIPWLLCCLTSSTSCFSRGDSRGTLCFTRRIGFREQIRIPGELIFSSADPTGPGESEFLADLRQRIGILRPSTPRTSSPKTPFVSKDLSTTSRVFVRVDHVRPPLSPPYSGPFRVVQRNEKNFIGDIKGKSTFFSFNFYRQTKTCSPMAFSWCGHAPNLTGCSSHLTIASVRWKPS